MVRKRKQLLMQCRESLAYLFFGVLTTLVNYLVYYPCLNIWGLSAAVSNILAWFFAVIFAFLTNKPFVFRSKDWSAGVVFPELMKFVGCRIGSGALETAVLFIAVDLLHRNGNLMKILSGILVVLLNYFAGKYLVFRRKN